MNIRDEARQEAEREMAEAREQVGITVQEQRRYIEGFTAGAVWASDQADRETSDGEVLCKCGFSEDLHDGALDAACETFRSDREPSDAESERARLHLLAATSMYAQGEFDAFTEVERIGRGESNK